MKRFIKQLLLFLLLFIIKPTNAQFIETESQNGSITVNEIKKKAFWFDCTEQEIKVQGFIIEQIGKHDYWFEDNSGRMRMEIKPNHMPAVPFNQKTEVLIYGEIDYYLFDRSEIEVSKIYFKK